ncbi:uncharacterized protein LOC116619005 isoform X2 [Nematostella vectensis]|uniref:uncharacterized protein LOC116619005 isoform X2 n=1 Tax=Nematostella vectensis TaxID=45351 RepID=UPI0020774E59|nr:uncharacterized protein LOC116619005 isoform X2 [Nematostella vectensis]
MAALNPQTQHTPFCRKYCEIEHHQLIIALLSMHNKSYGYSRPGSLHLLADGLEKTMATGWSKNDDVPDHERSLQLPLMFLACAFGNCRTVETLLKMGLDPLVQVKSTGESCLQGALNYLYKSGAWTENKRNKAACRMKPKRRILAFSEILNTLTAADPRILELKDNNSETVFHAVAKKLLSLKRYENEFKQHTSNEYHLKAFWRFSVTNQKVHFLSCLEHLLAKLIELKENGTIKPEAVLGIIKSKNNKSEDVFDILSCEEMEDELRVFKELEDKLQGHVILKLPADVTPPPKQDSDTEHPSAHQTIHVVFSSASDKPVSSWFSSMTRLDTMPTMSL